MGAGLLQWNTSALRAHWDPSNLRAMMTKSTCPYCFLTPTTVTVTFADVVDTACESGVGADYVSGTDVAANINGAHVCVETDTCTYTKTHAGALGDYGKIDNYGADAGCTPPPGSGTDEYDTLLIRFQVSGDTSFTINVYTTGDNPGHCFNYTGTIVSNDCDLTGPYSNVITGGNYGGLYSPANSGTATLVMAY